MKKRELRIVIPQIDIRKHMLLSSNSQDIEEPETSNSNINMSEVALEENESESVIESFIPNSSKLFTSEKPSLTANENIETIFSPTQSINSTENHKNSTYVEIHYCHICYTVFENPHDLKLHMQSHEKERIACEYCNKEFNHSVWLEYHMKTYHKKSLQPKKLTHYYKCSLCSRFYAQSSSLRSHKINVHKIFSCENKCGSYFQSLIHLLNHNLSPCVNLSESLALPTKVGSYEVINIETPPDISEIAQEEVNIEVCETQHSKNCKTVEIGFPLQVVKKEVENEFITEMEYIEIKQEISEEEETTFFSEKSVVKPANGSEEFILPDTSRRDCKINLCETSSVSSKMEVKSEVTVDDIDGSNVLLERTSDEMEPTTTSQSGNNLVWTVKTENNESSTIEPSLRFNNVIPQSTASIPVETTDCSYKITLSKNKLCTAVLSANEPDLDQNKLQYPQSTKLIDGNLIEINMKCPKCTTTFCDFQRLKRHMDYLHNIRNVEDFAKLTSDLLTCAECGKKYQRVMHLKLHLQRNYNRNVHRCNCDNCEKKIKSENDLKNYIYHERCVPKCMFCHKQFTTLRGGEVHIQRKHGGNISNFNYSEFNTKH